MQTINIKYLLTLVAVLLTLGWDCKEENPSGLHSYKNKRTVEIITPDTTSHNFRWEIDTLGDGNSSLLNDICIVNDTCIYAVGELHIKDSTGGYDPTIYNVARWNGNKWNLSSAAQYNFFAVYAFSPDDIWAANTPPYHWNGQNWKVYNVNGIFNGYIKKIWGISSKDLYIVGTNGSIAHFDGNKWEKMQSGTSTTLFDIWGTPDGEYVWACGWDDFKPTVLLRYHNKPWGRALPVWETLYKHSFQTKSERDSLAGDLANVWLSPSQTLYVSTDIGTFSCPLQTRGGGKKLITATFFPHSMRGNSENDFFVAGEYFGVSHFNGATWKTYNNIVGSNGRFTSVAEKGNMVYIAGYSFDAINSKGIVLRGTR